MEKETLLSIISNADTLIKSVREEKTTDKTEIEKYLKQLDPKQHDIHDQALRPDKQVNVDSENASNLSTVAVTRLSIPLQKQIVNLAASFLCGNPIEISAEPEDNTEKELLKVIKRSWKKNKLDYDSKKIAFILMSETEVAEIWFADKAPEKYWKGTANDKAKVNLKPRLKIIANSLGDELVPVFNNMGDMIAFGRGYMLEEDEKEVEHFDIYTEENTYLHTKSGSGWLQKTEPNVIGKIPVIYYSQPLPEWSDVQEMIDRLETVVSNHGDTNDYFGAPIVFVQGELEGFAKKGERGKVLVGKGGATAQYLSWDQSPESVKLEINNLRSFIYDMTSTPDISIEQMKALGTYSGIALKMLFLSAHLKASMKEETFGKGIQRRINFLQAFMSKINPALEKADQMEIEPKFEYYLPKNIEEAITLLTTATGGSAIMSQETAITLNPLVKNVDAEIKKIKEEDTAKAVDPNL